MRKTAYKQHQGHFHLSLVGIFLVIATSHCNDGKSPDHSKWVCTVEGGRPSASDTPCPAGERFVKGECAPERCDAADLASNCCPGQRCNQNGTCFIPESSLQLCTRDAECTNPSMRCLRNPLMHATSNVCMYPKVDAKGVCPFGKSAFNQRCIQALNQKDMPCTGGCDEGKVCAVDLNRCVDAPTVRDPNNGCNVNCPGGSLLVFKDPNLMLFEGCCEVACECAPLPPLTQGIWGRYADMSINNSGTTLIMSAYNVTFGDMVVASFSPATLALEKLHFVDGVPPNTPTFQTTGPRGGIEAPGPDVGENTALAVFNDIPYVTYYDLDKKSLKFAVYDGTTETWKTSVLYDAEPGEDVGHYSSIVLDAQGIAHVSYYAHRLIIDNNPKTGIFYARANVQVPTSKQDWTHTAVELVEGCHHSCGLGTTCVKMTAGATCLPVTTACSTTCECNESCVDNNATASCFENLPAGLEKPCNGSCGIGTTCVAGGDQYTQCKKPYTTCSSCSNDTTCVLENNEPKCLTPATGDAPCNNLCATTEQCVVNSTGAAMCLTKRPPLCGTLTCADGEICSENATKQPECTRLTPYSQLAGIPDGVGLFNTLAVDNGIPSVVYYDRLRHHLRAATALDSNLNFQTTKLHCATATDLGQHLAVAPKLATQPWTVVYQANAGESLHLYQGSTLCELGNSSCAASGEVIDTGIRSNKHHLVGGSADLAQTTTGDLYVVYADQTANDVVLSYRRDGLWKKHILLEQGAYGSFANINILNEKYYVSTFLRARDDVELDDSRVVIIQNSLSSLP